jgi:hypothetical protein
MAVVEIRVRPNSKINKVGGSVGTPPRLIVRVQEPAVDGKANAAVVRELSKAFNRRPRDISIVQGELARDKRILIDADEESVLGICEALMGESRLY